MTHLAWPSGSPGVRLAVISGAGLCFAAVVHWWYDVIGSTVMIVLASALAGVLLVCADDAWAMDGVCPRVFLSSLPRLHPVCITFYRSVHRSARAHHACRRGVCVVRRHLPAAHVRAVHAAALPRLSPILHSFSVIAGVACSACRC